MIDSTRSHGRSAIIDGGLLMKSLGGDQLQRLHESCIPFQDGPVLNSPFSFQEFSYALRGGRPFMVVRTPRVTDCELPENEQVGSSIEELFAQFSPTVPRRYSSVGEQWVKILPSRFFSIALFRGIPFDMEALSLLFALTNIATTKPTAGNPMFFKFAEGDGIIMPVGGPPRPLERGDQNIDTRAFRRHLNQGYAMLKRLDGAGERRVP
jgi:hypothetical protein